MTHGSECGCLIGQSCFRRFQRLYRSFAPCEAGRADLARAKTVREFLEMTSRDLPWLACCLLGRPRLDEMLLRAILADLAERGIDVEATEDQMSVK